MGKSLSAAAVSLSPKGEELKKGSPDYIGASLSLMNYKSLVGLVGHPASKPQTEDKGNYDAQAIPYMYHPARPDEADAEGIGG